MGRAIIVEDGYVPRAGDFQAGTVNIGDMEISDMAGYTVLFQWLTSVQRGCH